MVLLDDFWRFVSFRPGLDAAGREWRDVLGPQLWDIFRREVFTSDGIASGCSTRDAGRHLKVVTISDGYQLVCAATGVVEANGISEHDVTCFRLDLSTVRAKIAQALSVDPEPGLIRNASRSFPLGDWRPVVGIALPIYLIFPPTVKLLLEEIRRLLLTTSSGFILIVPTTAPIDRATRDLLDQKKGQVLALSELVAWDTAAFVATPAWQTYRDAYCARHLSERMAPAPPSYQFLKKGMWSIRFAGKETILDGSLKGPVFIRYLLGRRGEEVHVARMLADIAGDERLDRAGNAGGMIDDATFKECRQRYEDLQDEREDAEHNHPEHLPAIENEIAQLAAYFAECMGLGGKTRTASDDVAKIRKRIARVIDTAYEKIEENDPQLAEHLRKSVKTHQFMSYEPETAIDWNFD